MMKILKAVTSVKLLLLLAFYSVTSTENITNEKELLNQLEYCVFNDSAIRRRTSDDLLMIVNDTGDWLLVTNGSNLFMLPSNGSGCEGDTYNPEIIVYAIQTSIYAVIFLVTTCIIGLHLYVKELQTVFGVLTILLCFFFSADNVISFVHNRYQFTHKVNSGAVCAVFIYTRGILNFLSQFTKLTILFQFTYLMHNTYRVRPARFCTDKKSVLKYVIFIISMATIYSLISMSFDLAGPRTAFSKDNRHCAIEFHIEDASFVILIIQLTSIFVMQVVLFAIGIVLYYLVNERFCRLRSKGTRVCLTLGSTTGLNTFLVLVVVLTDSGGDITFLISSIGTCIQMSILLIIFLTSRKVKAAISPHNPT